MPLISLAEQGYFTPGQIIQEVAARLHQQRQDEETMKMRQAQFALEQRQRSAQAQIDEATAANTPESIRLKNRAAALGADQTAQEIAQGGQLFPARLRSATAGAGTAEQNLAQLQATAPLDLRLLGARTAGAEQDVEQTGKLNPLTLRRAVADTTGREQQVGAEGVRIPLDLRRATAETAIAEQNAIPTDEAMTSTTDKLGNITENLTKTKAGQPFGSASKIIRGNRPLGQTGGATKIEYVKDPITGDVIQTLVTRVDQAGNMSQQVIPQATLNPTNPQPKGKTTKPAAAPPAVAKPAASAASKSPVETQEEAEARLDATEQQDSKDETPSPPAAAKKGSTFADLKVGDEFMQNGTRYKKTGDKTAVPVAKP